MSFVCARRIGLSCDNNQHVVQECIVVMYTNLDGVRLVQCDLSSSLSLYIYTRDPTCDCIYECWDVDRLLIVSCVAHITGNGVA